MPCLLHGDSTFRASKGVDFLENGKFPHKKDEKLYRWYKKYSVNVRAVSSNDDSFRI